jgi:haloalkane dehalogenase
MKSMFLTAHALSAALVFGTASCEPKSCGKLRPEIEARFTAMRGPLGCEATQIPIGDPPDGCAGADRLLATARQEYAKLWAEGGCGTQPPDLTRRVNTYNREFAAQHPFKEHAIVRDQFTIAAREFGAEHAGTGPTIVLMHGFPDNQHLYDLVAPALGQTHHTVTFDFVGWGDSSMPPPGHAYTYAGLLRDLEAVLARFNPHQVVPVVHDASGWPGIDWALEHVDAVKALVLLNTPYHPIPGLAPPYVIRALAALDVRQGFIDASGNDALMTRAVFRAQVGTFFVDQERKRVFLPLFESYITRIRPSLFGLTETLVETVVQRRTNVPRMQSFPKPVSIAFGADDPYLNPIVAQAFHDVFPGSRLELIEAAGHYVQLDQPERIVQVIRAAAQGT